MADLTISLVQNSVWGVSYVAPVWKDDGSLIYGDSSGGNWHSLDSSGSVTSLGFGTSIAPYALISDSLYLGTQIVFSSGFEYHQYTFVPFSGTPASVGTFLAGSVFQMKYSAPLSRAFISSGGSIYSCNVGGSSVSLLETLTTGGNYAFAVTPDGALWYLNGSNQLRRYDGSSTDTIWTGLAGSITVVPTPANSVLVYSSPDWYQYYSDGSRDPLPTPSVGMVGSDGIYSSPDCVNHYSGSTSNSEDTPFVWWTIEAGGEIPPLRQKQRNDDFEVPRILGPSSNIPTSVQQGVRVGNPGRYL